MSHHTTANLIAVLISLLLASVAGVRLVRPEQQHREGPSFLERVAQNPWSFGFVTALILLIARVIVYAYVRHSSPSAIPCSVPLCTPSVDSYRYYFLTQYIAVHHPLQSGFLHLIREANDYEQLYLNGYKNGLGYAYVSAIMANLLHISAADANSVVSFLSAAGLAFVLRQYFRVRGLPLAWLPVAVVLPIFSVYGNENLKETWTVLLFVLLLSLLDTRRLSLWRLAAAVPLILDLYYDRSYYIFVAVGVAMCSRLLARNQSFRSRLAALVVLAGAFAYVLARLGKTLLVLRSYFDRYAGGGAAFGSKSGVIHGLPATLFEINVASAAYLAFYSLYVLCALLVWLRGRGDRRAIWNVYGLAFLFVCIAWTFVYGGGYTRGRDAVMPLLLIGLATIWREATSVRQSRSEPRLLRAGGSSVHPRVTAESVT